jgi:hypothetical protein
MATTPTILFRGAATTSTATVLYTVPASTTTIVSSIVVTNTGASAYTYTLAMGTAGSTTPLATTVSIAANTSVFIDLKQVLTTTMTITGGASNVAVNFHISGIQVV